MNFNDTKSAYAYKSDKDLRAGIFAYKVITNKILVNFGKWIVKIAIKLRFPIKPFTAFMFKQFCGGERLDEVINRINLIGGFNIKSIPDYSVEGESSKSSHENLLSEVMSVVDLAENNENIPFAVFKPTGLVNPLVLDRDFDGEEVYIKDFVLKLDKIFSHAQQKNVPVLVDAEDYKYQDKIDELILDSMLKYNKERAIVFTTLQMYRTDRLDYLNYLISEARNKGFNLGIKFVRGAYMESERILASINKYPDPIYPEKKDTDQAFNQAIEIAIENIDLISIFCGTHNSKSVEMLIDLMNKKNIRHDDDKIWFSQLYGMRDNISFALASEKYNIAKYIPYGPIREVIPYLMRRAEENSSVGSQAIEELKNMKKELSIRRSRKS